MFMRRQFSAQRPERRNIGTGVDVPVLAGGGSGAAPAPPFSPSDIAGGVIWFDMQDAASYTQAGTVTSITNKFSATAWTEAVVPPPYNATGLNGFPCMDPTGTERILSTEAAVVAAFTNVPDFTLFFVGAAGVADSTESFFAAANSGGTNGTIRFGNNTTTTGRWNFSVRNDAGTITSNDSAGAADTDDHVFCFVRSTTTISLQVDNGAADPSGATNNPGATTPNRAAICARPNSAIDLFYTGLWGELIMYDSALDAGNITLVFDYLKAKWGTP